jgi:hypothetical protein
LPFVAIFDFLNKMPAIHCPALLQVRFANRVARCSTFRKRIHLFLAGVLTPRQHALAKLGQSQTV